MIEAKIICDSVNPTGQRLTTFQLRYPRFIHAEFMTHRRFSRNASSSRAVPTAKLLEEVRSDALRAVPVFWGKNQAGMQAAEELDDVETLPCGAGPLTQKDRAKMEWQMAALAAANSAERMASIGAHKQIVNRIIEPFTHINVVCTATEYMNFFGLRLDKAAQPEMRALAEAMWAAYGDSIPLPRKPGEWHLPFVALAGHEGVTAADYLRANNKHLSDDVGMERWINMLIKISVARCARVSYMSNDTGKRSTVEEDLALYDRLLGVQPLHASPAEHQATPDDVTGPYDILVKEPTPDQRRDRILQTTISSRWANPEQHGNFVGWRQYRKMLPGESLAPLPEGYQP